MNEQMELFDLKDDLRVALLRDFIFTKLVEDPKWNPSAIELVEIGDKFKVVGRKPLNILEELRKNVLKTIYNVI